MKLKSTLENYTFVAPAVIIFAIFYIIPFFWVFLYGLNDWDGISPLLQFVGLGNFKEIFFQDNIWWQSMLNAGYITLIALIFQNALAFLLAWACLNRCRIPGF